MSHLPMMINGSTMSSCFKNILGYIYFCLMRSFVSSVSVHARFFVNEAPQHPLGVLGNAHNLLLVLKPACLHVSLCIVK